MQTPPANVLPDINVQFSISFGGSVPMIMQTPAAHQQPSRLTPKQQELTQQKQELPAKSLELATESTEQPTEHKTLLDVYAEFVEPQKQHVSKKQRSRHRKAATQFAEFLEIKYRSTTPILTLVDQSPNILHDFAAWMICTLNLSTVTVSHRLTDLLMIMAAAADAGLIAKTPARPAPPQLTALKRQHGRPQRKVARSLSIADTQRLVDACDVATYPTFESVTAPEFWRVMICLHALYGPRTQDIYAYLDKDKTGLTWPDVFLSPDCPDPELRQAMPHLTSPHGWLYYPVGKDKRSACPFVLLPMPDWLSSFVQRMKAETDPARQSRVFPVSRSKDSFAAAWSEIRSTAGLPGNIYLSQGTGGAIALRKTAAKWWRRVTASKEVAQYLLHHTEVTTAEVHYLDTMEAVIPQLLQHLHQFPVSP
jgi:integrase